MKPHVIIITGQSAALKTTTARQLTRDFSAYLLCKDDLKETLAESVKPTDRNENLRLSATTVALMTHLLDTLIPYIKPIIIEANFKEEAYLRLLKILSEANASHKTIYCFATFEVLYRRYLERFETVHETHKSMGLIEETAFRASMADYEAIYRKHAGLIRLDTTHFDAQEYASLKMLLSEE